MYTASYIYNYITSMLSSHMWLYYGYKCDGYVIRVLEISENLFSHCARTVTRLNTFWGELIFTDCELIRLHAHSGRYRDGCD